LGRQGLQHAPQYSQAVYLDLLRREVSLGNYFMLPSCHFKTVGDHEGARKTMVLLMEELHSIKGYRELTLFLAVNIADHYLASLARNGDVSPNVVHLGVVSLLLAVKMNEPVVPNLQNMVILINQKMPHSLTLKDLTALERRIIIELDFDLQTQTSIIFMERYCQLFYLD